MAADSQSVLPRSPERFWLNDHAKLIGDYPISSMPACEEKEGTEDED